MPASLLVWTGGSNGWRTAQAAIQFLAQSHVVASGLRSRRRRREVDHRVVGRGFVRRHGARNHRRRVQRRRGEVQVSVVDSYWRRGRRGQDFFQLDHLCTHNTTCDFLLVCWGSEIQVGVGASTSSSWITCVQSTHNTTCDFLLVCWGSEIQIGVGASTSSSWITCVQSSHNTTCDFLLVCCSEGLRHPGRCRTLYMSNLANVLRRKQGFSSVHSILFIQ